MEGVSRAASGNTRGKVYTYGNRLISVFLDFIELVQVSEVCLEVGAEIDFHFQFAQEITVFISGTGVTSCNGVSYPVKSGDINVISDKCTHYIAANSNERLRFICMNFRFTDDTPEEFKDIVGFYENAACVTTDWSYEIKVLFDMLLAETFSEREHKTFVMENLVKNIIVMVKRKFAREGISRPDSAQEDDIGGTVYKIIKYVDDNILSIKGVGEVAEALSYSKYYVSHVFKEKIGMTLQNYIIEARLEKAMELLKERKFSVADIALKIGYESPQGFSKAFKKRFGMSPMDVLSLKNNRQA